MYEIFARLLKEKGLTTNKVSVATGITSATFSSWKKGIYTPKREKMQKIADFLDVSIDYLMGTEEKASEPDFSPIDKMIIHELTDLDADSKRKILEYIQFLKFQNAKEKNKKTPHE